MNYQEWQAKRKELGDKEKMERANNWDQARAHFQAAITEQAIRELYDMNRLLAERVVALEMKRGPGRPPKSESDAA